MRIAALLTPLDHERLAARGWIVKQSVLRTVQAQGVREDSAILGLAYRGLTVPIRTPLPVPKAPETHITAEAGLSLGPHMDLRAESLVQLGDVVKQGQPILRDRRRPECVVTAPMSGRVIELEIGPGRRLSSLVIASDDGLDPHLYEARPANDEMFGSSGSDALRALLQAAGLWMHFRSRPFGRVPAAMARPAAILIAAADTRPLAADPQLALDGHNRDWLQLGLSALVRLGDGPVHLLQNSGADIVSGMADVTVSRVGALHPSGLAGFQVYARCPAQPERPVWNVDLEVVVAIGQLLATGSLPATRLVSVAGPGMQQTRLVRCQPGADLREICHKHSKPGQTVILSGSVLDGSPSRWLGFHDRQVTVLNRSDSKPQQHWLDAALRRASRPEPIIATAAVEQALGGMMAGMALLRALSVGDDEAAAEYGALSLLEEDMALVDYVTAAEPRFADLLRAALDRIEANQ
ncbi:MAG: Na(+)-translocating NADH-quinone reductase subunit A [Devosia sp.]|nr:Na(+)-translocating NADH-quinone reductase subunit A [Devosia sp.]